MPDVTLRRASVGEIVLAVRQRIADTAGVDLARVLVVATGYADEVPHEGARQDVLLAPAEESLSEDQGFDGGGRYVDLRRRNFEVIARSRVALDRASADLARLTDESLGHFALEDLLVDGLEGWFPLDTDGNALATPLVVRGPSRPRRDRQDPAWVSSTLTASFQYLRALTLPEVT